MFRATSSRMAGFVFRENRVPYYQRLFQNHDGKRQWWKTSRSGYLMYPYLISVYGLGAATTYAMCRMVLVSFTQPSTHLSTRSTSNRFDTFTC
ncbi:unnamed protein product [Penicillium nalgiovense]|uniref:Uncharacterized protein n=1 Tax=Penicillium nalgiovense TaxID=60175 RepID=A0A9W4MK41_PENNA|nr:unnamed protein product [Penicillium nalgiovense]CAG7962085.1 unnamed protein product [Penicillium nalgiovense]CAG7962614.1 unnamed protein product [Penicillium nalgiovense]CAG7967333.1 unnamed protein product [Penicillium nalgiovense]CAG7970196.1 unnamed protein product [Penicillium nalgiovense]